MTFSTLSLAQQIACQQLTSHISAWAAIPAALTVNNPIRSVPGSETDVTERMAGFASRVRACEKSLLAPLDVHQSVVDYFLGFNKKYAVAFSHSEAHWLNHEVRAQLIRDDMEPLSLTLRSLEQGLAELRAARKAEKEFEVESLYDDIETLRRIIASRAGWAEEVAALIPKEPCEAVSIFYDSNMRLLRALHPMVGALDVYHTRRSSLPPPAE
ncbi:MAG TPA: hypothetical protein VFX30_12275 [bacterium]|nr:hypothetical protein [bacterium]